MGRRKKRKKKREYDPAEQARRLARALLGIPPSERIVPAKKHKKKPKHKKREREGEWD